MLGVVAQVVSINAMGRVGQIFAQKAAPNIGAFPQGIRKGILTQLPASNRAPFGYELLKNMPHQAKTGKQRLYELLENMQIKAKSGILPTNKEFSKFRSDCVANDTNMINAVDKNENTLLSHVVNNTTASPVARKKCINELHADGAELNPRDKHTIGSMANLAYAVNKLRLNASASDIVKTYRALLTKNTGPKMAEKVAKGKMTELQREARIAYIDKAQKAYARAEHEGLLVARELERTLRKNGLQLNK